MDGLKNRGIKCLKYCIVLNHRGHIGKKDIDILVKFKKRIVERIGYARWHKNFYMYHLKEDRLMFWVNTCNVKYSYGFKKFIIKMLAGVKI